MIYLTEQNNNSRDIIQNIFSPLVGVITSPLADEICQRNNLSFVELLQPFSKLTTDSVFRDVTGTTVSMRGLRLNFCDIDYRPPQTVLARKLLNESVTNAQHSTTKTIKKGNIVMEIPVAEPWFENWRETFLSVQFPADHEFTRHLLSCLIVLSSTDPNIIETATKLTQQLKQIQSITPQKLPKWFQPNDVLNSYVLLHESTLGDLSLAQQRYELLKSTFSESKCFLVQINSYMTILGMDATTATTDVPNYWSSYIKKQPKTDVQHLSNEQLTKDNISVISLPTVKMSTTILPADCASTTSADSDINILHPLSPELSMPHETLHSNFSVSNESLTMQTMKSQGSNIELNVDIPHYGAWLNSSDIENLRHFVQDYAIRALIPYVERLVANLNEAITNKKGVSKSLLSATKRWFVTSKPGAGTNNQNAVIYTYESTELQTRRLGDLYFMFGHYNLAFQAYHQAKRDFNAESAWQYYAGALEMAALSAFMLGTANRKTYDYMENAIVCYLTVCKLQQLAIRATLLSIECLKTANLHSEAAKQLIRMTSEESDLRSALLLEQAAYCYLACQPSMHRKYAFHIVLAGNRYSRVGQRKHAYRCYNQANQVFENHEWSLAEDHILYTMAKHAYALKRLDEASRCYSLLLRSGSSQNSQQITIFLKDYIQTQNEYLQRQPEVGILVHATPKLEQNSVRLLVGAQPCSAYPLPVPASNIDIKSKLIQETVWHKLEEVVVITTADNRPFVFRPTQSLFTRQNQVTEQPMAVQGESVLLSAMFVNNTKCKIVLSSIELLWKLQLENDTELTNAWLYDASLEAENTNRAPVTAAVQNVVIPSVELEETQKQTLFFKLTPKLAGHLSIIGVVATVAIAAEPHLKLLGALYFESKPLQLQIATTPAKTQSGASIMQTENILNMRVVPTLPLLNVSFTQLPNQLLAGEVVSAQLSLCNQGIVPIDEVYVVCDGPRWFTLQDNSTTLPASVLNALRNEPQELGIKDLRRQHVHALIKPNQKALKSQDVLNIPFWIQAPYEAGEFNLRLLFYYVIPATSTTPNTQSRLKYRLIRHAWEFNVQSSLNATATCVVNNILTGELAIDVSIQNEHSNAKLYIDNLQLYSAHYTLNTNKFFIMNQSGLKQEELNQKYLKPGKCTSFLAPLETRSDIINGIGSHAGDKGTSADKLKEIVNKRLSKRDIMPAKHIKAMPNELQLNSLHSFLLKNESSLFHGNESEAMPNLNGGLNVTTVILKWTALFTNNDGTTSTVRGEHFLRLQKIYTVATYLSTMHKMQKELPNLADLYMPINKKNLMQRLQSQEMEDDFDDEAHWELNTQIVSHRCLLEDGNYLSTLKT